MTAPQPWWISYHGGRPALVKGQFCAKWEYELDELIRALKITQRAMRLDVEPLPRSRALVPLREA